MNASRAPHWLATREALIASILGLTIAVPSAKAMALGDEPTNPARLHGSQLPSDVPLRIEIDPAIASEDAELLRTRIVEQSVETGSARAPASEGHEQLIAVRISGVKFAYLVSVIAMRDGEPVEPAAEPVMCRCSSKELLTEVDARILAAAEELRRAKIGPGAAAAPEALQEQPDSGPVLPSSPKSSDAEPDGPRRRPVGPLGYSGIGVGILGAATLGTGVALVLRPDEVRGPRGSATGWTTHPPGIAITVGGGVALATGVVLVAVDLVRGRNRSLALVPAFGSRQMSLMITRRF